MRHHPTPSTPRRLARGSLALTALLLGTMVSCAQMAGASPTPPGGGGGITIPQPCVPDLHPCEPDPCDIPGTVSEECPPPPNPCDGDQPPSDECPPPQCEDGKPLVDGECPRPDPCDGPYPPPDCHDYPDPCEVAQPPQWCTTGHPDPDPDPGGHGSVDQPVPGRPTFTG
jgi:hypothetical protein